MDFLTLGIAPAMNSSATPSLRFAPVLALTALVRILTSMYPTLKVHVAGVEGHSYSFLLSYTDP